MFNRKNKLLIPILFVLLTAVVYQVGMATSGSDNIYKQLKLINNVLNQTITNYVDPIDYKKFVMGGIKGALSTLDPHTTYFKKEEYDDLKTSTKGEFGGLGIQIGIRDDILTVIAPIEGTPAYRLGLRPGDQIIEIEGKSTRGFTTDDAIERLRGDPGTDVTITIRRIGETKPIEYTITRDIIEIKSVPFYGMAAEEIGFIRLTTFSEKAAPEIREALQELKAQGMKKLILDLRSNPGGLLNQAVRVSSFFLRDGDLIVYTEGGKNYRDSRHVAFPSDVKFVDGEIIVLINGGSASASEIVSGAIQDNDRGLVLGQRSFGKGLVQQVISLDPVEGDALKVTSAKYYIPSGRCIQKEDYLKWKNTSIISEYSKSEDEVDDEEEIYDEYGDDLYSTGDEPDSTDEEEDLPEYKTMAGRTVYGGGGITPDIPFEAELMKKIEIELERKSVFFGFALKYAAENEIVDPDIEITDEILQEFKEYLKEQNFTYELRAEEELDKLKELIDKTSLKDELNTELDNLTKILQKEKEIEFEQSLDYIKMSIKRDLISNKFGNKARYEYVVLKQDKEILEAVKILQDPELFSSYFSSDKQ